MQSISDIRHRIRTVKDTEQITRAMNLISVSKMRRAQQLFRSNFIYFEQVRATLKDILKHASGMTHNFLQKPERNRAAYVVIAGDKGLCGGYNHNILSFALDDIVTKAEKYILTVGYVARDFFESAGYEVDIDYIHTAQNPSLHNARRIASDIIGLYDSGIMDEVYIVFTEFLTPTRQRTKRIKLLPMEIGDFDDVDVEYDYNVDVLYQPTPDHVFSTLVPQYIIGMVYSALVQASASEHSSRMIAMDTATRNAQEMLRDLTLKYNRARQERITNEIIEIVSGANATA